MQDLNHQIKAYALEYFDEVREIRRHIHKNPELSFEEHKTAQFVQDKLNELNISFTSGHVKTGVVGHITGKVPGKGKTVALRADMDALPIQESNSSSYCSINDGVMHACGHDVHTASLLGAAKIIKQLEDSFSGTIVLIFQPGEEEHPGGAKLLLEEGVLQKFSPDIILGQHVLPEMEVGHVGFRSGMYMASGDEIHFKVKGKGGHGALPHKITDTVLTTAHVITSLQQIVSRNAPATIPTVLSFGKVIADGATNIIPNEVTVAGTFRTMDETWRAEAKRRMVEIGNGVASSMGAKIEMDIKHGYPVLHNDEKVTQRAKQYATELLGEVNVEEMDLRMTCEDFAYYSLSYPVCFMRFGVRAKGEEPKGGLHTPKFDIDENALKTSMANLAYLAIRFINE
ncbi:amidohydrolase [Halosquirtibacter laminarini]|uniref:Amidohydrolase n=1 Tax=Halosquirtibacter laminarini TaxID=3374600 RepID=A0AC61ND50_9BACT|nr:amidohydrolase [Prolixibacteraceae bacterium]